MLKNKKYLLHDERAAIKQVLNYIRILLLICLSMTEKVTPHGVCIERSIDRFAHKGFKYTSFNDLAGLLGMSCFYPARLR